MEKAPDIDTDTQAVDIEPTHTCTTATPIPIPAVYIPPNASPVSDIDLSGNMDEPNTGLSLEDVPVPTTSVITTHDSSNLDDTEFRVDTTLDETLPLDNAASRVRTSTVNHLYASDPEAPLAPLPAVFMPSANDATLDIEGPGSPPRIQMSTMDPLQGNERSSKPSAPSIEQRIIIDNTEDYVDHLKGASSYIFDNQIDDIDGASRSIANPDRITIGNHAESDKEYTSDDAEADDTNGVTTRTPYHLPPKKGSPPTPRPPTLGPLGSKLGHL